MIKIIKKRHIKDLLITVSADWDIYAPQRHYGGDIWIEKLDRDNSQLQEALNNVVLDYVDTIISPKDMFFPQLESMFKFKGKKIIETIESSPKFLFGIKSCDLKGLLFVDDFYKRNFEDIYYLSRAINRFTVVMGCNIPPRPNSCFCTSAKTGPFADNGYDLQLIDGGNFYFAEVGSKDGEDFVMKHQNFFDEPKGCEGKTIDEIKLQAFSSIELKVDFQRALELMANDDFIPEENYRRIGERCIFCGGCLYVCPTCTCFNVFDSLQGENGIRYRNWDTCIFEGYTREASGHNPRREKWLRTSRRYEHKLKYDYQVTGMSGCIGCGRCFSSCPVDIGISKFIQEITEKIKII